MTITLPYPPSANRYWRRGRGFTYVSKEAQQYKLIASALARRAGVHPIEGEVAIWIRLFRPQRSGDLDNRIKVLLDALNGVAYRDDKQVAEIHAERREDKRNPRVEIELKAR